MLTSTTSLSSSATHPRLRIRSSIIFHRRNFSLPGCVSQSAVRVERVRGRYQERSDTFRGNNAVTFARSISFGHDTHHSPHYQNPSITNNLLSNAPQSPSAMLTYDLNIPKTRCTSLSSPLFSSMPFSIPQQQSLARATIRTSPLLALLALGSALDARV